MNSNMMILFLGLGYIILGFLLNSNTEPTGLNHDYLIYLTSSLTISSALFSVVELVHISLVENIKLNNLRYMLSRVFKSKIEIYEAIENHDSIIYVNKQGDNYGIHEAVLKIFDILPSLLSSYMSMIYCLIFASSFMLPLFDATLLVNNKGLTLISFGGLIAIYGIRASLHSKKEYLKKEIWFNFYKEQSEKLENNHA